MILTRPAKQLHKIHKHYIVLVLIALAGFCFTLFSFYPGYFNVDSINQLQQAQGKAPLTDWHPPAMALLWRLLIFLTGNISSLLVFQLLAYWLAFGAIAITIRKQTGSLKLSLLPFVIAILPTSLIISGFYLKDVLMAALLCLASALLYIGSYTKKKTRLALFIFITATILIIYSGTLRHNALPALIPLAYAASYNFFSNNRKTLLATIAIIALVPVSMKVIEKLYDVKNLKITATVMVDDLKSILTEEEIMASNMAPGTKDYLIGLKKTCIERDIISFGFLLCGSSKEKYDMSGLRDVSTNDYDNIKSTWISSILDKPLTYVQFRLSVFWRFMTDDNNLEILMPEREDKFNIDLTFMYFTPADLEEIPYLTILDNPRSKYIASYTKVSDSDPGLFFKPYFWIVGGIILLIYHRYALSRLTHTYSALATLLSGALYVPTYIPTITSYDYRFIYWTVLATGISLSIFLAEHYKSKNNPRSVYGTKSIRKPVNLLSSFYKLR